MIVDDFAPDDDPFLPEAGDGAFADDAPPPARTWDPRTLGCLCDRCALRGQVPVAPDFLPGALLTVIAEAPGKNEVKEGRPLVGPSGREMNVAIELCGHRRYEVSADNVILCRIPAKNIDALSGRLRKQNARREVEGEEPLLHPFAACAPHLDRTIERSKALLVLGKTAFAALTGARQGEAALSSQRGFPMTLRGLPAVATWHPAHVLRNRRWTAVFRSDVAKAFRHAAGRLEWTPPRLLFNPTVGELDAVLDRLSKERIVGCDCETEPGPGREEFDPEFDTLRCVALGTREFCVCLGFKSVPNQSAPTVWRTPPGIARERIRNFFARCVGGGRGPTLVMHNGNVYDRPVLRKHGMPLPDFQFVLDTLLLSRNAWSELGHDLDFLMSWYTDATKHKGRKGGGKIDHSAWESDAELHRYCMYDVAADVAVLYPLLEEVKKTKQQGVFRSDLEMQRFAEGAHRAGMKIDPVEVARHEERLLLKMQRADEAAQLAARRSGAWRRKKPLNLASPLQVREFLYDGLMLPLQVEDPEDEDAEGTTKRDAIYELLQITGLPDHAIDFCEALLEYRSAARTLSKDIRGLHPNPKTGRVHPHWGTLGVTGRPQSTDPNCFDGTTEVLTRSGWVRFDRLERGAEVAQYTKTGGVEFVVPSAYVRRRHHGEMVELRNQHTRLRVTPDHRCVLRNRRFGGLHVFRADEYPEDMHQLHAGMYGGGALDLSEEQIILLVAMQADGTWTKRGGIEFTFRKQRKIQRLRSALRALGISHADRPKKCLYGPGRRFYAGAKEVDVSVPWLRKYLGPHKLFGPWVLELSRKALSLFCAEVFRWDGTESGRSPSGNALTAMYASQHEANTVWVQTALSLSGWRSHFRTQSPTGEAKRLSYQTSRVARDYSLTTNIERAKMRNFGRMVYCLSVPSSYLLVRRDGQIMVTGQCSNVPSRKRDPDSLRSIYIPEPGCVFVYCDLDQIELRAVAALSGDRIWLDLFHKQERGELLDGRKIDMHCINASVYFDGKPWTQIDGRERDYAKCVVGETRVPVSGRGLVRIRDLGMAPAGESVPLTRTKVIGSDGKTRTASAFYCGGEQPTVRIATYVGYTVEGTRNHRVLMADGRLCRLDKIRVGDEVALPTLPKKPRFPKEVQKFRINPWVAKDGPRSVREFTHDAPGLPEIEIGESWGYLIGAIQGDGTITPAGISVCGLEDDGVLAELQSVLVQLGLNPTVKEKRKRTGKGAEKGGLFLTIVLNSKPFRDFLRRLGVHGGRHKIFSVPDVIFRSPEKVVAAYLAGLFDTDGYVQKHGGLSLCTKSRALAGDVQLLLDEFGVHSRVAESFNKTYQRMYYLVTIGSVGAREFVKKIRLRCSRKMARLVEQAESTSWCRKRPASSPVVSVEPGRGEVFDLCVPDGHLFVSNGLIGHNTLTYMYLYSGGARRALLNMRQVLKASKDGAIFRPYATMLLKQARDSRAKFLRTHHWLPEWWEKTVQEWRNDRFLREPILGRVRYFLDGEGGDRGEGEEQRAELVNFRAQSSVAGWMSGTNAVGTVMREIGWPWYGERRGMGGRGLIHHGYDSMMVEVSEDRAEEAARILTGAMTTRWVINGNPIAIPTGAKIGRRWSEVS